MLLQQKSGCSVAASSCVHAKLLALAAAICLITNTAYSQKSISIYTVGFDQIIVKNNLSHSVTVNIGNYDKVVLSPHGTYPTAFRLNGAHVFSTEFTITYDYHSFLQDSLLCVSAAEAERVRIENKKNLLLFLAALTHGTKLDTFISFVRAALCIWLKSSDCEELIYELSEAYGSSNPLEQRLQRMRAIIDLYFEKIKWTGVIEANCIDVARNRLQQRLKHVYYAYEFINRQERSRFELTPFSMLGYRTKLFREVGDKNSIQRKDIRSKAYYGGRVAFNFNAYNKYGKRKIDTKYYIPLTFMQSPVVYKLRKYDKVFNSENAFQWRTYSIGFGWEANYYNVSRTKNTYSAFFDVGVASASLYQYGRDSLRLISSKNVSNFNGFSPYANLGYKFRIANWLDLYGAYYTVLAYNSLKYNKKDFPAFRQFNVGLNFNFGRHFSYQY